MPHTNTLSSSTTQLKKELYKAETVEEGLQAFFRVVPHWVPVAGVATTVGLYYVAFRLRLFVSKWRIAERRRAEKKYELLDNLRGMYLAPVGHVEALVDDDGDEEDEEEDDETAVSMRDVDEFRSSLGIRLPRDDDLLGMVEKMLIVDPIPDGWMLYRTTAGIIRFMNLNTQELYFFHPGKCKEQTLIETELKRRNRQAMESKFCFSYEDEVTDSSCQRQGSPLVVGRDGLFRATPAVPSSALDFAGEESHETHNSAFRRLFHYFMDREQKKIEQEVARARTGLAGSGVSTAAGGQGTSGAVSSSTSAVHPTPGSPAGAGTTANSEGTPVPSRHPASMTYRVVASSAINANR